MREVVVFFKGVQKEKLKDPGPQLEKVIKFRDDLEKSKQHLFMQFGTTDVFEKQLRRFLGQMDVRTRCRAPRPHGGAVERGEGLECVA
jgi:hypothetical protein